MFAHGIAHEVKARLLATLILMASLFLSACGTAGNAGGPPGSEDSGPPVADEPAASPAGDEATTPAAGADTAAEDGAAAEEPLPPVGEPGTLTIWSYLAPDDPSVKAYIEEFQKQNPEIKVNYTAFPEDNYQTKVGTALQAQSPPDIAVIENRGWMKAGLVEELSASYKEWGVDPNDFNPGGMARLTAGGGVDEGIYGVGDFLGGNVLFYNKALFDAAGLAYPSTDKSLTWPEYAEICRKIAKPDPDPTKAVYGCSVPDWGFGIWSKWVFGEDGRTVQGNMNSPAMVEAWNLGTALVRERMAPNANILETMPGGESDLFAQGKLGITWSDFTEATKYQENDVSFGLAPFYVPSGSESFVDTWTAPWGTFKQSKNKDAALQFLKFIATDGQRIRMETSADPPLSTKVADEMSYGEGDPIKQEYLKVLQQAKPQVFVPPLPEGAWDSGEIFRVMTTEEQTDAKPLLDAEAEKTQPLVDEGWANWESLGQ